MVFIIGFLVIVCILFICVFLLDKIGIEIKFDTNKKKIRVYKITTNKIKEKLKEFCLEYNKIHYLENFHANLVKIKTDFSNQVKPYDVFNRKEFWYFSTCIVIDKYCQPKLVIDYHEYKEVSNKDYYLSKCFDEEQLNAFIKKCKEINLAKDIEEHRLDKIEKELK